MTILLLWFLSLALSHELPKIGYVIVSSSFTKKDMEDMQDWKEHIDDLVDYCEENSTNLSSEQRDKCEDYIESISSIVLSNGRDINEKLTKVSKKIDYLFYIVHSRHINVDFNNLPKKMEVFMFPINFTRQGSDIEEIGKLIFEVTEKIIQSSFDGTQESRIRLSQLVSIGYNNHKKTEILMEGSIFDKVSFLTISHMKVVYSHEFRCENAYLSSGVLVSMTNSKCRVNNFIIDTETFTYYSILHYLVTDQFTLVDFNTDNSSVPEYQIAYYDLFWGIQCVYDGNFVNNRYHWKVPYFVTKKFAIICYSHHIIIEAVNQSLVDYPDVNITVTNEGIVEPATTLSKRNEISIESKGFDGISEKIWPSVFVTYNKEKFSLDSSKSDLNVEAEQIYTYKQKPHHGASAGLVVGIVAAVVAVIAVVVIVVVIVLKKRNANKTNGVYEKTLLSNDSSQQNSFHDPVSNALYSQA